MLSWNAAQTIWSDTQASRSFQSIPLRVPFSFLSPTRHCTKWCFVSRQQTVSPPLVTPVSALPSCPMASAPIRIYCRSRFILLASRGPCSAEKSNAKEFWRDSGPHTLWHIQMAGNGWRAAKWKEKKHSQKKRDEHWTCLWPPGSKYGCNKAD